MAEVYMRTLNLLSKNAKTLHIFTNRLLEERFVMISIFKITLSGVPIQNIIPSNIQINIIK